MKRAKWVGIHPQPLPDGHIMVPGGRYDVDETDPEVAPLFDNGTLIEVPEDSEPTKESLLAEAKELGIEGRTTMDKPALAQAIADKKAELAAQQQAGDDENGEGN